MTRVLVTGGSGFIGSHVIADILRRHPELVVRAMDLLRPRTLSDVEWHQGSILDVNSLSNAVRDCDYVLHLAAMLGVKKTEQRRIECLNTNILGTVNVFDACVRERVKKVVFMSSSEVYGDQDVIPIAETNPVYPKSVYAVSKLAGEEYLHAYAARYGLDYSIVRFFNVYGQGQVAEFVISRFVKAVIEGDVPIVYGDGSQVRAFNYVTDAARDVVDTLLSERTNGETLNIGNSTEPISMRDLAYLILKIGGLDIAPRFIELEESDRSQGREIQHRIPDVSKAGRILGHGSRVRLEEGIRRIFAHGVVEPTWHDTDG